MEHGQQLQCMIADECAPRTKSTCFLDWLSTTVFVCLVVYAHDLTRHRALTSLIACGYLRFCARGFSLLSLEACSCRGFVMFLSVAGLCNCTKRKFEFASCVSVHEP